MVSPDRARRWQRTALLVETAHPLVCQVPVLEAQQVEGENPRQRWEKDEVIAGSRVKAPSLCRMMHVWSVMSRRACACRYSGT